MKKNKEPKEEPIVEVPKEIPKEVPKISNETRYRVVFGLQYPDKVETHAYYHTLKSVEAIIAKVEAAKIPEGVSFSLVYRHERATKKIEGMMSDEAVANIIACIKNI